MVKMFFVIKHQQVLRNPRNPKEGFMNNESFHISKNPKSKDLQEASIILDVGNQKVIKNRFSEKSFEDLFKYAVTHYSEYINKWTRTNLNES
jgi:hypothetical protein